MKTLMQANANWRTRPDDERYTSLIDLDDYNHSIMNASRQKTTGSRKLNFAPGEADAVNQLVLVNPETGNYAVPTHSAFGKLATLAGAPAGYLRSLPAELAAHNLNFGMQFTREPEDVSLLYTRMPGEDVVSLRSANGPNYGRVWNAQLSSELVRRFGDGIADTPWRAPGEFGKAVEITKANTTFFAGETSMFVFLADEINRIQVPNRRNGQSGSMSRGFFCWNSETGDGTIGAAWFLFDHVCSNRIVWGVGEYSEKRIRHTASAPDKWLESVTPVINRLADYSQSSDKIFLDPIKAAQDAKIENVKEFLKTRFSRNNKLSARSIDAIEAAHFADEGRPMETLFDITTGMTAFARSIPNQDSRVALEIEAGAIMALVA